MTNASRLHGLGFVLMQHKDDKTKVIQCGSRSLSPAEKNYSTLALELAAIVWAIQKCNFFLKGIEKFEVVTDHRPLIGIFTKPMPQIDNKRITRLCEKILDRPFQVKWMAGKENVIADALSRAPAASTEGSTAVPVSSCVIAPSAELANITECCQADPAYRQVVNAFNQGRRLSDLPVDHPARRLKQVWGQISQLDNGMLLVDGDKLYLPPGARADTLHQLHEGHCRYRKTLQTARALYHWAFDETRHQDHDRQMRGLPAAEAEQTCRASHHDIGQLPYGANFRRSVSRQGQNVHGQLFTNTWQQNIKQPFHMEMSFLSCRGSFNFQSSLQQYMDKLWTSCGQAMDEL